MSSLPEKYSRLLERIPLPQMDADELLDLVDYYTEAGDTWQAELYFRLAQRLYPQHPDVLLTAARWSADDGDWAPARALANELGPEDVETVLFRTEYLLRSARMTKARDYASQAINDSPEQLNVPEVLLDMASLFRDYGDHDFAYHLLSHTFHCDAWQGAEPQTHRSATDLLVECQTATGRSELSEEMLSRLLDEHPFDLYYWTQLARAQLTSGRAREAVESAGYAAAISPSDSETALVSTLAAAASGQDVESCGEAGLGAMALCYAAVLPRGGKAILPPEEAAGKLSQAGGLCPRGSALRPLIASLRACELIRGNASGEHDEEIRTLELSLQLEEEEGRAALLMLSSAQLAAGNTAAAAAALTRLAEHPYAFPHNVEQAVLLCHAHGVLGQAALDRFRRLAVERFAPALSQRALTLLRRA